VQRQLGVDRPDYGVLFADMARTEHEPIDTHELLQLRIKADVAFILGADLPDPEATRRERTRPGRLRRRRLGDRRQPHHRLGHQLADTVADNGSSGLYVLGPTVSLSTTSTRPRSR
jgi:2-keto-4-pentenoate hydratase